MSFESVDDNQTVEERIENDEDDPMVTQTVVGDDGSEQTQTLYSGSYEFGTQLYHDVSDGPVTIQYECGDAVFHFTPDVLRIDEYSTIRNDYSSQTLNVDGYGLTMNMDDEPIESGAKLTVVTDGAHHYRSIVTEVSMLGESYNDYDLTTVVTEPLTAHER